MVQQEGVKPQSDEWMFQSFPCHVADNFKFIVVIRFFKTCNITSDQITSTYFDPWEQPPPILYCVIPSHLSGIWYFELIIMSHLINKQTLQSLLFPPCPSVCTHTALHKMHHCLKASLSFCCVWVVNLTRITFNPSPPLEEQHSTLLPPPHPSSHTHHKAPLTHWPPPPLTLNCRMQRLVLPLGVGWEGSVASLGGWGSGWHSLDSCLAQRHRR